jgi:hypothetical protein
MVTIYLIIGGIILSIYGLYKLIRGLSNIKLFKKIKYAKTDLSNINDGDFIKARLTVTGTPILTTPFTKKPCFYYKTILQKYSYIKKDKWGWKNIEEHEDSCPFSLTNKSKNLQIDLKKISVNISTKKTFEQDESRDSQGLLGNFKDKYRNIEYSINENDEISIICSVNTTPNGISFSNSYKGIISDKNIS